MLTWWSSTSQRRFQQGASPVHSPSLLCFFVASLAQQGLAPGTIKTYLAGVRHAQIIRGHQGSSGVIRGHPEPRQNSTLPRLHLLQAGVRRERAERGVPPARPRLPITLSLLRQMRAVWNASASNPDTVMLWAAAATCFFGFFPGWGDHCPFSPRIQSHRAPLLGRCPCG